MTIVLVQSTDFLTASISLFSLFFSELLCCLLVAGFQKTKPGFSSNLDWEDALAHVFLRWILIIACISFSIYVHILPFFESQSFVIICIFGLTLVFSLNTTMMIFGNNEAKYNARIVALFPAILALLTTLVALAGPLESDTILALALAAALLQFALILRKASFLRRLIKKPLSASGLWAAYVVDVAPILFRYADIFLFPWVLSPSGALTYLIVRGCANSIALILGSVSAPLVHRLKANFTRTKYHDFVAIAARANLGILLIGGGSCLAILSVGPHVLSALNLDTQNSREILLWAVVAQSIPVIFGSTWLFLDVVSKQEEATLFAVVGAMAVFVSPVLIPITTAADLARIFAIVHLCCGAAAATFLAIRFGIWPGITAVLFRQIKLL